MLRRIVKPLVRVVANVLAGIAARFARNRLGRQAFADAGLVVLPFTPLPDDTVIEEAGPRLAPIVVRMAGTGAGTNACLAKGALPMPVHFYSPVPDIADLDRRNVWDQRSALAGVAFNAEGQLEWLRRFGTEYGAECRWPRTRQNGTVFWTGNCSFSFGCAALTHCVIRHFKPRRVVEVGSGFSSRVIAEALRANKVDGVAGDYVIVDPYPGEMVNGIYEGRARLIKAKVEESDPTLFGALGDGDVLFIDSSHMVKIGGDVNFLVLDVLPRLAKGVVVHFHDIPLPWPYGRVYATNPAFRVFWTEAYLLQAFLACNRDFEVLSAVNYLMVDRKDAFRKAFPHYDPSVDPETSGSFWIRRTGSG